MASVTSTFVPTYQGLSAVDFVRPWPQPRSGCFPFDVVGRLPFYRARNAIYHLFAALVEQNPALTVLAPDYNSGNEILAMRTAGAHVCYCPVDSRMQLNPVVVEQLCDRHHPDVLYVIHYVGWPQPITALVDICRRRGMLLVEDCALSLLSATPEGPLGRFGDWSVFCLYKTLPLPNGALLLQNNLQLESLDRLSLRHAGAASVLGRTAELVVQRIRGRASRIGAALQTVKRGMGAAAGALDVRRANVGDIGFNLDEVDLAMSGLSMRLLQRFDFDEIRRRRVENYMRLDAALPPSVARVFDTLPDGVCPLFFPILVEDKQAAARALQQRGIDALEFWNDSVESGAEMGRDARCLRAHVLELPIHQDLTPRHIAHLARQVAALHSSVVGRVPRSGPDQGIVDDVVGRVPRSDSVGRVSRSGPGNESTPDAIRVSTIDNALDLAMLRSEWNALLSITAADGPFLTWEWLDAWWTHLSGPSSLRVIVARKGDDLIAIAPFRLVPGAVPGFSRLAFLGTGYAGSDYLDLIARPDCEEEALGAIAGHIAEQRMTLRLDHVPESSLAGQLANRLGRFAWTATTIPDGACPVIPLDGHSWDSYLATLGPAHRANVRRRLRGIERHFEMRFDLVTTEPDRRQALDALVRFHDRRFQAQGGSSAFCTTAVLAFQQAATRSALDRGWLRMYVLRLNEEIAAVMYGLFYGQRFYFYQHGFDDRYARHSIGLVLMALTIRMAITEGAQAFDMLWGTEGYKALWARETRRLARIHLFPPHMAGRIHRGAIGARRRLGRLARRVLHTGGRGVPGS